MLLSTFVAEDDDVTRQGLRLYYSDHLEARVTATKGDGLKGGHWWGITTRTCTSSMLSVRLSTGSMSLPYTEARVSREEVVLSLHKEDAYMCESLQIGASGYVLKGASFKGLTAVMRAVMKGKAAQGDGLSEDLFEVRSSVSWIGQSC